MGQFQDKIVVVLGGNSGIGLATARRFREEGAQVVVTGRDVDTLATAADAIGDGTRAIRSDIRDIRQVRTLFRDLRETVRRIDVLFVNAGVGVLLPIESITESDWDSVIDTNLKGVFFSVQQALPLLSEHATIVLTGSIAGVKGEATGSVYAASKAGLRALGRSFAAELVGRGIRVNVVSPGPVETPMLDRVVGVPGTAATRLREEMAAGTPMQRLGTSEEIAEAVLFLAGGNSTFITGVELYVDGGIASF